MDSTAVQTVAQHLADGRPLATEAHGVSMGSIPGWLQTLFSGGIFGALLLFITRWRGQSITQDGSLLKERASQMADMREEINTMRDKVETLTVRCTASEIRVQQLDFALRVAVEEIDRLSGENPNPIVSRIKSYLGAVSPMPSGITQEQMDQLRAMP